MCGACGLRVATRRGPTANPGSPEPADVASSSGNIHRQAGACADNGARVPTMGCLRRQWDGCIVSDASVVNCRKSQLREGRIEAALSMKDTGPESASRREGRSQRQ